jgi:hypothetical protein
LAALVGQRWIASTWLALAVVVQLIALGRVVRGSAGSWRAVRSGCCLACLAWLWFLLFLQPID